MGDEEEQPRRVDPGATMQIDALVDDMEDVDDPNAFGVSRPPPLPPKKPAKIMYVIGVLVVLLAAGLGVVAGLFFFGYLGPTTAPETVAMPPPPPPQPAPEPPPVEPPAGNVVQM